MEYNQEKVGEDKQKSIKKRGDIIINNIFPNAAYLVSEKNVGHEIINIFGPDKDKTDKYYYYLNPSGKTSHKPEYVLSVSKVGKNVYQIINLAKVTDIEGCANTANKSIGDKNQKGKFLYKGKPINKFFENNSYKNANNDDQIFVTYICESIKTPKNTILLKINADSSSDKERHFYSISTGSFHPLRILNFNESDQEVLQELVHNEEWGENIQSFKDRFDDIKKEIDGSDDDLFTVLGIDSLEVPYSNFIRYILEKNSLTNSFLNHLFSANLSEDGLQYEIFREKFDIDLLFTNINQKDIDVKDKKIFIIENKIESDITLSDREVSSIGEQIEKVIKKMKEDKKGGIDEDKVIHRILELDTVKNKTGEISQLSKYYIYAVYMAIRDKWTDKQIINNIKCALLCPEYLKEHYKVNGEGELSENGYLLENLYVRKTYKDLEDFFSNKKLNDSKYNDFLSAIKLKASIRDDSIQKANIKKFIKMIQ